MTSDEKDFWVMRALMEDKIENVPTFITMDHEHMFLSATEGMSFLEAYDLANEIFKHFPPNRGF